MPPLIISELMIISSQLMKLKTDQRRTLLSTVLSISDKRSDSSHEDQVDLRELTVQQQRLLQLELQRIKEEEFRERRGDEVGEV